LDAKDLDEKYLALLVNRIAVCRLYKPKFGQGGDGVTLETFQALYQSDSFYAWFGLDHPLMYAAHKAAGGITSIYRQIGIGSEDLFRQILQDHLGLSVQQANWSYTTAENLGRTRILRLDGRIHLEDVADVNRRSAIRTWILQAAARLAIDERVAAALQGIVVEVRQGYKSKDSKRQNADMANAAEAYISGYLPVLLLLSTQIDTDVVARYVRGKWFVLRGMPDGDVLSASYAFIRDVIGYDLAGFFARHHLRLREIVADTLQALLSTQYDE
jgi:hypothetical protein